jgi:hypothetical protein
LKRFLFLVTLLALVAGMAAAPTPAKAGRLGNFGLQGGWGDETDWFIGVRSELMTSKLFPNSRAALDFAWFFPSGSLNYWDVNLNYLWPLTTLAEDSNSGVYIGAGLNVGYGWVSDTDYSDWEVGMNGVAGFNFDMNGRDAFLEGRYTFFSDFDQFRVGVGFLF